MWNKGQLFEMTFIVIISLLGQLKTNTILKNKNYLNSKIVQLILFIEQCYYITKYN